MYGLNQPLRALYEWFDRFLIERGCRRCVVDGTLYVKTKGEQITIIVLWMIMIMTAWKWLFGSVHAGVEF